MRKTEVQGKAALQQGDEQLRNRLWKEQTFRDENHCAVPSQPQQEHSAGRAEPDTGALCLRWLTHRRAKPRAHLPESPDSQGWGTGPSTEICNPENPTQGLGCKPHTEGPCSCENRGFALRRLHLPELTLTHQTLIKNGTAAH